MALGTSFGTTYTGPQGPGAPQTLTSDWDYYGSTVNGTSVILDSGDGETIGVIYVSGTISIHMGLEFGYPTLLFRWAQNTSSTYETTVLAGSFLSVMCVNGDDNLSDWKIDEIG